MRRTVAEHEEKLKHYQQIHKESAARLQKITDTVAKLRIQIDLAKFKGLKNFDDETFNGDIECQNG